MKNDDIYHSKYIVQDPKTILNILLCIGLVTMIGYEFIYGKLSTIFPLIVILPLFSRNLYSSFNSYRRILLFNDKIQISGLFKNTFSEIYYDTIEHIGFVKVNVRRSFLYTTVGGSPVMDHQKLILLLAGGGKVTLPEPSQDEMNEILEFINAKIEIGNFAPHGVNKIASSVGFDGDYSQIKFVSSKTGLYVCASIAILFCIVILFSALIKIYFACVFIGVMLIPAYTIGRSYYTDYREFLVYDDRIRIVNFSGSTLNEIYFNEIKEVGFLNSGTYVYNASDSEGVSTEEMILLLDSGGRESIKEDVSNLHELCSLIQQKIAKNN